MRRIAAFLLLIFFGFVAFAGAQDEPAKTPTGPTSADFFSTDRLHEVRLFISSRDLVKMRENYWDNTYYPADFLWDGIRVRNAGIRIHGLATRSATKPGFRVDFNRYVSGQKFLGLHSLILDNVLKDPAMVRDRVAMAFIAHLGYPASRESMGRVYINGVDHGVYGFIEPVDKEYLARTIGENGGYLFDHKYFTGFHAEDLGDDLNEYKIRFEAQTRKLEPDGVLYSPIRELFREINHDVDAAWRSRVGEYLDLNQLVTFVAIENFLAESDGFLGFAGMANFSLYRPADSTLHRLLPWDRDSTFQDIEMPIFARVEDNQLVKRALRFGDLRARYLDTLEQCARAAADGRWLDGEMRRAASLISDAAHGDRLKLFTNEEYDQAMVYMLDFAKWRPGFVLDEVAKARQSSDRR